MQRKWGDTANLKPLYRPGRAHVAWRKHRKAIYLLVSKNKVHVSTIYLKKNNSTISFSGNKPCGDTVASALRQGTCNSLGPLWVVTACWAEVNLDWHHRAVFQRAASCQQHQLPSDGCTAPGDFSWKQRLHRCSVNEFLGTSALMSLESLVSTETNLTSILMYIRISSACMSTKLFFVFKSVL